MEINFARRLTLTRVQVVVLNGRRRALAKVGIPACPGCRITGMIDEAFVEHSNPWQHGGGGGDDDDRWILRANYLPAPNRHRATMREA